MHSKRFAFILLASLLPKRHPDMLTSKPNRHTMCEILLIFISIVRKAFPVYENATLKGNKKPTTSW